MTDTNECELCGTFDNYIIQINWFEKKKIYAVCVKCSDYIRARNMNEVTNE